MRRIGSIVLAFILYATSAIPLGATYTIVLQSGHEGAPVAMEWHQSTSSIVSAGEDGRLIVTRPRDGKITHRFRVSGGRIHDLKLNPADQKAALVISEEGEYKVSVWDWVGEKEIYSQELSSEPLFLSWSAQGRYLTIGNLGEPSIIVLEGQTGRRLPYLQRLPSLYNAGYIGSTESILMTYSSTGAIRYWDIRSSALRLSAETITNLRELHVLQIDEKSSIVAHRGENLYLIDRQTGAVMDQLELPGLFDVSVDGENGEIDVLARGLTGSVLYEYRVTASRFVSRNFPSGSFGNDSAPKTVDPSIRPVRVLRSSSATYLIGDEGNLVVQRAGSFVPLVDDRLWRPDAVAFHDQTLRISGGSTIRSFISPFFDGSPGIDLEDLETLSSRDIQTDSLAARTGISSESGSDIILWDTSHSGARNGIRLIDRYSGIQKRFLPLNYPVLELDEIGGNRVLTVDRSGGVRIVSLVDGSVEFEYNALGILDAATTGGNEYILAGRSSTGSSGRALEQIDVKTREAVPIPDGRFMVYRVQPAAEGIYTIGVTRTSAGSIETSLMLHDAEQPDRPRVILNENGEYLDAIVLPHPAGNGVFTTLGGRVQRITGTRKTTFLWHEDIVQMALRGNVLYGIDRNGALVLWNVNTGRPLLEVYLFNDGGWIAMPPDGDTIWASPGAVSNVIIYRDGRPVDPLRISGIREERPDSPM